MLPVLKLRPDIIEALHEYSLKVVGLGMQKTSYVTDPAVIERLTKLALPNEDLNDTILRLIRILNKTASIARH